MGSISGIRIKGVAAAAYFYFGTSIDNITSYQAAILISLLNGPYFYHPLRNLKGLQEKTNLVYQKLKKNKVISSLANEDWNDLQWEKWKKVLEDKKSKSYLKAISYMQKNPNLTEIYPKYAMLAKALTTLRAEKQKHPEADIALKIFSKEINCKEFPCTKEFHYYSKVEKDLLMGIQSEKHQVGSLLKPLIYRFYLNEALEWDYMIDTTSYTLELKSGHWTPKDAKKAEQEYITLKEAYQRSRNVPLVRVAHSIGFSFLENYLLQYIPNLKTPLEEFPSQILGSIEMSIKEIAEVFEEFMQKECQYYINDQPNVIQPIFEHGKTTVRYRVPNILKEVRFFGKTGTSNDGIDNWYVGIESNKVTVIWMGLETNKSNPIKGYSGSSLAFPIYINYLAFGGKSVQELDCEQLVNNRLQKDL
jgi:penicillin-binding protein 1B